MDLDPIFLSRIQFALTIMFHYLFPPLTIGMGGVMVYLEAMYLKTREPVYESAARFWTGLFAVTFALGVATGIVMEFQFGTNWAAFSRHVGDVFGSALAFEGIFAFFLESGFLAVVIFGWGRVNPKFHFFATTMVALGSAFSAVWIIVANSWQQTPAGHRIVPVLRDGVPLVVDGLPVVRAELASLREMLLNPSTGIRLAHTLIGAYILGGFFIMSISAWFLLRGRHGEFARRSFTGALLFAAVFSIAALVSGHSNARMVAHHQPAKLAAFEGHFVTGPADLSLFGIPLEEEGRVAANVAVPGGLSFLVHDDFGAEVIGLDRFRREDWPPVALTFGSYHLMVALGFFFIAITLLGLWFRWKGTLFEKRWLLWIFVFSVIGPFLTNEAGWVAAEVGRQPWTVYPRILRDEAGEPLRDGEGHIRYVEGLRTERSGSAAVTGPQVLASIGMFGAIYVLLFGVWIAVLDHKIRKGPPPERPPEGPTTAEGLREAASGRARKDDSMTEAKEPPPDPAGPAGEGRKEAGN